MGKHMTIKRLKRPASKVRLLFSEVKHRTGKCSLGDFKKAIKVIGMMYRYTTD